MPSVTIFGSSSHKSGDEEYQQAEYIGTEISTAGFDIITGGYYGIMEAALKGATRGSGRRIGVTLGFYSNKKANQYVSEEVMTFHYLDRMKKLIELGDSYIIMPGSSGTLLEFAAVLALSERGGLGNKPIVCIGKIWNDIYSSLYHGQVHNAKNLLHFVSLPLQAVSVIKKHFSSDISNIANGTIA